MDNRPQHTPVDVFWPFRLSETSALLDRMAYDVELADRLRDLLEGTPTTEKRMFGGLAFLVNGHMAVAVSGQGGLMVRCAPEDSGSHVAAGASRMEMRGKEMDGWLRVTADAVEDDAELARWVDVGVRHRGGPPAQIALGSEHPL